MRTGNDLGLSVVFDDEGGRMDALVVSESASRMTCLSSGPEDVLIYSCLIQKGMFFV